ncbi:unnamed protein product, partial [Effrenium voratum]
CIEPGKLKPCRPFPHIKLSELLEKLVKNDRGHWLLSGTLNAWPALTGLELVSVTCKVGSVMGTNIRRLWLHGHQDSAKSPQEALQSLQGKKLRSVRATFQAPAWTSVGWSSSSPGFVLWYAGGLGGRFLHGKDMVAFAQGNSTCTSAVATKAHFFTHRYAKATEGIKDRLIWHGAVLVEWSHGLFSTVVELAWLNGLGGYQGRCNWIREKLEANNPLYAAMPSGLKGPWQQNRAELRVVDVRPRNLKEFESFLQEFSGTGALSIAEQRFFEPYVAYSNQVHLQHRSHVDILNYLLNYINKNPIYEEARRNCQTFASDFYTLLTGQEAQPTQSFCRVLYKPRVTDFLYTQ